MAQRNRLRERIQGFAEEVMATLDRIDFDQRQKLLRLVVEQVRVQGWQVEIRLRIPLDGRPDPPTEGSSTKDRLRSLHLHQRAELPAAGARARRGDGARRQMKAVRPPGD